MYNCVSVNKYIYMILQGCVKQFKCKTIKKNVISIWGRGGFHIVFGDKVTKMGHCERKTIKTFVFWDAPQLTKLINMNHNYKKINT